jgi:hypothetical protein
MKKVSIFKPMFLQICHAQKRDQWQALANMKTHVNFGFRITFSWDYSLLVGNLLPAPRRSLLPHSSTTLRMEAASSF